jgi:hypothetical protein
MMSPCDPDRPTSALPLPPRSGQKVGLLLAAGALAALAVVIGGAEMLARWWSPDLLMRARGFHVFSGTYGWVPRKGSSVVLDGKRVSFNAHGYRGPRWPAPGSDGRTRVVVLGDSIAFGLHVGDDETFTQQLDARDNGIEALNLAVQGYGPGQELLVLAHDGLGLGPDVVVLAFCLGNDFAEAVLPMSVYDGRTPKPRYRLVRGALRLDDSRLRQSVVQRLLQRIADESYLFNLVSGSGGWSEAPPVRHWRERYDAALRDQEYALELNLALVRRMSELCRQREIAFLVAAFPDRGSYNEKPPLAERFLARLEAEGIRVLDMAVPFHGVGPQLGSVALDGVGHLSPLGHALTARVLEDRIHSLDSP